MVVRRLWHAQSRAGKWTCCKYEGLPLRFGRRRDHADFVRELDATPEPL